MGKRYKGLDILINPLELIIKNAIVKTICYNTCWIKTDKREAGI